MGSWAIGAVSDDDGDEASCLMSDADRDEVQRCDAVRCVERARSYMARYLVRFWEIFSPPSAPVIDAERPRRHIGDGGSFDFGPTL